MNCLFSNFFQSSLTEKVSQQELVFNDTMIEKEQTINDKLDFFNLGVTTIEQTVNNHEQKLQSIVSVNVCLI